MQHEPSLKGNHSPEPPLSTDKLYYQSRKSWGPSTYKTMGFANPGEDGLRAMDTRAHVMAYTQINGKEPTGFEKGFAPEQKSMGSYNNSFKPNL